jgi:hypothetical protein
MLDEEAYENALDASFMVTKAKNAEMTIKEIEAIARRECSKLRLSMILSESMWESAKNDSVCCEKQFSAMQSVVKLRSAEFSSGLQSSH